MNSDDVRPKQGAPQHSPRPLPLFLDMIAEITAHAPERRVAALAGLAAYQRAERPAPLPPLPEAYRIGRATLRIADGAGPPVLFVPSLINPPEILDLDAERSIVRWIAAQGFTTYLLDWGEPGPSEQGLSISGHVEHYLLALIAALPAPPILVGYCLGGTMAIAAAARVQVAGLATIAAPWHFQGYGDASRTEMVDLWAHADPACRALGLVPMEVMQAGFWRLDPERTVAKYEAFGRMAPGSKEARTFVKLEDWANGGAPLTYAAGRQLFRDFVGADAPGHGRWTALGRAVLPSEICCPSIEFVSATDRIVPAGTAPAIGRRVTLSAGHVGMVVSNSRARLWTPLVQWLAQPS